jgi:DNA-binding XRE family transcriptional regulator
MHQGTWPPACLLTKTVHECTMSRVDLSDFLERVDASDRELAAAIGANRSTVYRIRTGKVIPKADTAAAILRWAETKAKEKRLPVRDRLTFDALVRRAA